MAWGGPGAWWPLLIMMPLLMAAVGVTMMIVLTRQDGGFRGSGPGRSLRGQERGQDQGRAGEDPLAVLRERYARGEIGHEELDRYLDRLIRSEPGLQPGGGSRD